MEARDFLQVPLFAFSYIVLFVGFSFLGSSEVAAFFTLAWLLLGLVVKYAAEFLEARYPLRLGWARGVVAVVAVLFFLAESFTLTVPLSILGVVFFGCFVIAPFFVVLSVISSRGPARLPFEAVGALFPVFTVLASLFFGWGLFFSAIESVTPIGIFVFTLFCLLGLLLLVPLASGVKQALLDAKA